MSRPSPWSVLAVAAALAFGGGCSASAQKGAASGAKMGAIGGVVAGAVGSIVFDGDDVVNDALRSAAVGAASGAAVGAVSGSQRDKASKTPAPPPAPTGAVPPDDAALRAWVGEANYAAGEELANCRHTGAIARAEQAFSQEADRERKEIALLIQAMAAEESSNVGKADDIYRRWAEFDPARADREKARADALAGILKIQKIRQQHGLPVLCS